MRCISRQFRDTGADYNLSPEQWLSSETASRLAGATPLRDIVQPVGQVTTPPAGARFVLDTNNARDGLLDLPVLGNPGTGRVSAKKTALEGDVIVSRLRPYLRQVAMIPPGASELLEQRQFYCSTEFFVLRRKDGGNAAGLVAWLLSEPIQSMMSDAATGGHHPRINVDLLLSAPVEDRYIDPKFSASLSSVLARHLQCQRELLVLLRHGPGSGVRALRSKRTTAVT